MKKRTLLESVLVLALVMMCFVLPVFAEESQNNIVDIMEPASSDSPMIDWTSYSYDELLLIRDNLDTHIHELERQYAIENGNRIITLNETDPVVYLDKDFAFRADVKRVVEDAPETTKFVWTSSDETIAKISAKGVVTGVSHGNAVITCTAADDEYIFATATVHVVLPVTDLVLDTQQATLLLSEQEPSKGDTSLNCTVTPENAYVMGVTWSSSDEGVATVDENGKVHAVAPGTANIIATSQDPFAISKSISCKITVLQPVSGITLSETGLTLNVGANQDLTAAISPENATKKDLLWESSNPEVATVSKKGRVTAVSTGTAEIICTAADGSGVSSKCEVTVIQMVNKVTIESASAAIMVNKNESITLSVVVSPEEATNKALIWESSNVDVATVDSSGTVTAINGGAATITCTAADGSNKTAKADIYVPSIAVDSHEYTVTSKEGLEIPFKYYGKPNDLSVRPEKTGFCNVSLIQNGEHASLMISPNKAGTCTITLSDKTDRRSEVKLTVVVEHSACYDSTSYPRGDYTSIMRSPSSFKGTNMSAYGRVLQVSRGLFSTVLRVATNGRWDNVFYITCYGNLADGIIEDDYITVYGECDGTETYTTIMGGSVTIPAIDAEKVFLGKH